MVQLGRVFVSSVFGGMLDARKRVQEAAQLLGLSAPLTEEQVAQAGSVKSSLETSIESCDLYVGMFATRRGTVPTSSTPDQRAITEQEFHYARAAGLRCLVFLSRDGTREPGLREFLDRDVTDYEHGVWTRSYDTPEQLHHEVVAALSYVRPRVRLSIDRIAGSNQFQATLDLRGVKPAWQAAEQLGPVPVDLNLSFEAETVRRQFHSGRARQLREDEWRLLGVELAQRLLPGALSEALTALFTQAGGNLLLLEVASEVSDVMALPLELLCLPISSGSNQVDFAVKRGMLEVVRQLRPAERTAPKVSATSLQALGFTASPLEDLGGHTLGDSELFWEREQENLLIAFRDLIADDRGWLDLPDTGAVSELQARLKQEESPVLLHFSCHGGFDAARGEPVLLLEDDDGHRSPVGAGELQSWIHAATAPLALVTLSACHTGAVGSQSDAGAPAMREQAPRAGSWAAESKHHKTYATQLVHAGAPAVLAMQTSVSDAGATEWAKVLYGALSRGADLSAAQRLARPALAANGYAYEWAIPVLYLSGPAWGPIVSPGATKTASAAATAPALSKRFELGGVTYLETQYVGRRDYEHRLRHAWKDGARARWGALSYRQGFIAGRRFAMGPPGGSFGHGREAARSAGCQASRGTVPTTNRASGGCATPAADLG